jgi:hypothetical protein
MGSFALARVRKRMAGRTTPEMGFEMSEALQHPVPPVLLHIASSALIESAEAIAVEQWVDQAGMTVGRCPDVYLGLAQALGKSPRDLRAVLVSVEDLLTDEFEFFSLLSRARRDFPVLVYGTRCPDRVIRALQSGAKGLATQDAVLALSERSERPAFREESALATPPLAVPPPSMPVVSEKLDTNSTAMLIEEIEDEPREDANPAVTARVPWLRYSDGPARQRPSAPKQERVEPSSTGGVHDAETCNGRPPGKCEREYEPLLTEQELAALLADDLDDVALQEREMLTGDGELPGSGTR